MPRSDSLGLSSLYSVLIAPASTGQLFHGFGPERFGQVSDAVDVPPDLSSV